MKAWINRAQRTIAERRDWTFMHDTIEVIVPANETRGRLGGDFKALDLENSPVTYRRGTNITRYPIEVASRAEAERRYIGFPNATTSSRGYAPIACVFIEASTDGVWSLNVPEISTPTDAVTFRVSGYFYPPALIGPHDETAITRHGDLCEALIARTKVIGYSTDDPTDKRAQACAQDYELHMKRAIYSDASRKTAGRTIHA